jgi:hypothetical protein
MLTSTRKKVFGLCGREAEKGGGVLNVETAHKFNVLYTVNKIM